MPSLDLKTEQIEQGKIRVSWRDFDRHELHRFRGDMIGGIASLWFLFCIFAGLISSLTWLLYGIGGLIAALIFFKTGFSHANDVTITKEHFISDGRQYLTQNITRIAFGSRQSFTGNPPYHMHLDATEIRAWINDNASFIISSNAWDNQANARIRNEIDAALQAIRKPPPEPVKTAPQEQPKTGKFGLPDY